MKESRTSSEDFLGHIVRVVIDRPLGSCHPEHADIIYGVNYGYIPDTMSPDGEELDAYVLGVNAPLDEFEGRCIAVLRRRGDDDDKLIVVPEGAGFDEAEIRAATAFQEKFFESVLIFKAHLPQDLSGSEE
jgi:inorganic pyrophosphatase